MNLYEANITVYFASKPNEEYETLCTILDGMYNVNTNINLIKNTSINLIEDTGEDAPLDERIVDDCPSGDWTCPYFVPNGCTLEGCREECDAWNK